MQVAQIAAKHRMTLAIPASIIIGQSTDKNRMLYTDPYTQKLVVKTGHLSPTMISDFIKNHMNYSGNQLTDMQAKGKRRRETHGVVAPKYIMKLMARGSTNADVQLYYCKSHLLADMMKDWGTRDIIV